MHRKKEETHVNQRRLAVRLAATTHLVADSLPGVAGATTTEGRAVVIEVAPDLLATSRRQCGLLQTSGVVEAQGLTFGLLAICGEKSGHLVVLPLGTPEIDRLLETVNVTGSMWVVMADTDGDGRVAVLDRVALRELLKARSANRQAATREVLRVLLEVVAFLASESGAHAMPEPLAQLDRVTVHALVPELLLDAVLQSMLPLKATLH